MSWAKLDDKFHSHPKVLTALSKGAKGLAAIGLWAIGLSWCGAYQTAEIPSALVRQYAPGKSGQALAAALVEAGLWHPTDSGDFEVHDWAEYQSPESRRQVATPTSSNTDEPTTDERQRAATRERVARHRERQRTCNAHETPEKTDVTPSVTEPVTLGNAPCNAPCNAHVTEPVTHTNVTSLDESELAILVNTRARAPRPEPVPFLNPILKLTAAHNARARESMPEVQAKPAEPPPPAEPVAPVSVDSEAKTPPPAPPSEPTPPPESTERPIVAPKPNPPAHNTNQPSTPPQSATSRLEAVLAECSALSTLNRQQLASLLEGRRMSSGKPLEWVIQAIKDADRSAATSALGGEPLSNSRLADLVVRYCDHARAPRPEPVPTAAAHPVKFNQIVQSQPAAAKNPLVYFPPWHPKGTPNVCAK